MTFLRTKSGTTRLWGELAGEGIRNNLIYPLRRSFARAAQRGKIPVVWYSEHRNWGDALNPILVALLSKRKVVQSQAAYYDRFLVIGSILGGANARAEVWGTGFIKEGECLSETPKHVHAVRGPLTRAALLSSGIDCPQVFGDPALLLPLLFNPEISKSFNIGVIPHYADKRSPWLEKLRKRPDVRVIDVQGDTWEFVRAVKSCRTVLSSSLHGLICADSYNVPTTWIKLSENIYGGDFKFRDYRLAIGAPEPAPFLIEVDTEIDAIAARAKLHTPSIDLRKLLLACPFLAEEFRSKIESGEKLETVFTHSLSETR